MFNVIKMIVYICFYEVRYDILAASDAIEIGNEFKWQTSDISFIVKENTIIISFTYIYKYIYIHIYKYIYMCVWHTTTQLKQIGSRAGRSGTALGEQGGFVTCLLESDLERVKQQLDLPVQPISAVGLFPPMKHIRQLSNYLQTQI